jgi:hypothetical protein
MRAMTGTKALLFCVLIPVLSAQVFSQAMMQGDKLLSGGIGLVMMPGIPPSREARVPPVGAGFEYGFHEMVSGGAFLAMSASYWRARGHLLVSFAAEANFHPFGIPAMPHFAAKDKLDPYAGILLGFNAITDPMGASAFLWGIILGCHYFITDSFGLYGELGRGFGWFNLGVTVKL